MSITVRVSGPIFHPDNDLDRLMEDIEEAVADAAYHTVHGNLASSLRNPTGYYQAHIEIDRRGGDRVVHDSDVIYGPWLEGTGSRNDSTRFKGYASFRRAAQTVEGQVDRLVRGAVSAFVRRVS